MKHLLTIFLLLLAVASRAQEPSVKKPAYVIIMNDSIVPMEKVNQAAEAGDIKAMRKGVSEEEMAGLRRKLGDGVGNDRRFIMIIELLTPEEKRERALRPPSTIQPPPPGNDGFYLKVNDRPADFTVEMTDGRKVRLSALRGKVVLLNFWATWCGPCIMEFHEIPSVILQPFRNRDFVFLPVSVGEKKETVLAGVADLQEKGIRFPAGFDPDKKVWKQFASGGIPKNFVIDQQGVVRYVSMGYGEHKVKQLAREIEKLLQQ